MKTVINKEYFFTTDYRIQTDFLKFNKKICINPLKL